MMDVLDIKSTLDVMLWRNEIVSDANVRICVGNKLYNINNLSTCVDVDTNKKCIVLYAKEGE